MEFLSTLYYHIRYNYPLFYFGTLTTALVIIIINIITITATTGVLNAIGAASAANRIVAAKEAAFWTYRAWSHRHSEAHITPQRVYGYLQTTNRDGSINLLIAADDSYKTIRVRLADLQVTNPTALAAIVSMHRQAPVDVDLYTLPSTSKEDTSPHAVIWLDNKPFNIDLIIASVALPDENPPTDIVDRAFAAYHWKIATGEDTAQ